MDSGHYGRIRRVSATCFAWDIQDTANFITSNTDTTYSPFFEFREKQWRLCFANYNIIPGVVLMVFCFYWHRLTNRTPCTQKYRIYIRDIDGEDVWTSPTLTHEFAETRWLGRPQAFYCKIGNNWSSVTPGDVLSLHLSFYPSSYNPKEDEFHHFIPGLRELSWNLNDLLLSGQKSDVTLNVRGTEFKAHQAILLARSSEFYSMFASGVAEHRRSHLVNIEDCDPITFNVFLIYLYSGNVEKIAAKKVLDLYFIADKYDVKELAAGCVKEMMSSLSVDLFCEVVTLAMRHREQELLEFAELFLAENVKEIISTNEWKTFNTKNPAIATALLIKALQKVEVSVVKTNLGSQNS